MEFIHAKKQPLWEKITETRQLDIAAAKELDAAIAEYQGRFAGKKEAVRV